MFVIVKRKEEQNAKIFLIHCRSIDNVCDNVDDYKARSNYIPPTETVLQFITLLPGLMLISSLWEETDAKLYRHASITCLALAC